MEIGEKYGKLTCISKETNGKKNYYLFKCDCGNIKYIAAYNVRKGNTKSCGCLSKEHPHHLTHGLSHTRIDAIYKAMVRRCYKPECLEYDDYGGRGIKVCDEWLKDRTKFYEWAFANGYNDELTIDRIDVNGNYDLNNCRCVIYMEQGNNKRNNIIVEYAGKIFTLAELCRIYNLSYNTTRKKLRKGKSIVEIIEG